MKKFILILFIALVPLLYVHNQNYIGLHKDELIQVMRTTQRNFKLNTDAINSKYRYLKYEDRINEQTMLFFLSEDDFCTYVRLMCDYMNLNNVIDSLNKKYTRTNQYTWTYKDGENLFNVNLEKGEWFFTVNINKE